MSHTALAVVGLKDAFRALGPFFAAPAEDVSSCGGGAVSSAGSSSATRAATFFPFGCCCGGALLLLRAGMEAAFSEVLSSSLALLTDDDIISTAVVAEVVVVVCLPASVPCCFDKLSAVFDLALSFRIATAAVMTGTGESEEPSSKGCRSTNFCVDGT